MTFQIPEAILGHHAAILGKTGSGKTSTTKLIVERVVAQGARVCVLDPVKSDWWGLISSADGKRPGLPFRILGGPHGHVPLHSGAGKAIGEIVATGKLPLSIIDMADFEPGGLAKFFNDFAPALLKKMRGVLYRKGYDVRRVGFKFSRRYRRASLHLWLIYFDAAWQDSDHMVAVGPPYNEGAPKIYWKHHLENAEPMGSA